jgi:hypothetical protein
MKNIKQIQIFRKYNLVEFVIDGEDFSSPLKWEVGRGEYFNTPEGERIYIQPEMEADEEFEQD